MDCGLPGSSVHGILQATILERVATPFSGYCLALGIKPESPALQADSLPSEPPGGEINQKDKYHMSSLMESKKQTYQTHTKRSEIRLVIRGGGDGVRRGVIGKNLIKLYKLKY